ncbi:N-acyl-D-aspartate/D-glutamate deacylase [Halobacteroides halobius DSM 5150]|uniref:N-acyl-D-aspartate/D-glutamate deacylase n=1 Tax=Halobacteroides halobius (strain ATCC 35273 / DSM 5150 / MD-1) TaxID=748449 RepID=L0K523_HALHC|nr:D-aminoacylase [Halobacteroides halobius]AGB40116.1 N-acyl-D-aspartate/D-glutamate deacylase [Halobacteroides halobius DSM 5150]
MLDILIKQGLVVDGTGRSKFKGDIGIQAGKIIQVGSITSSAKEVIDAQGLIVAPGFIDIHSHGELAILVDSRASSKVYQGITTEVVGNCGSSLAPVYKHVLSEVENELDDYNLALSWYDMEGYLNQLSQQGIGVNIASLVGHGLLRKGVIGYAKRKAKACELKKMKQLLEQALKEGAYGLSTGLVYPPSSYASMKELIELAKIVADYNGLYTSHLRDEGDCLLEAVKEAITIGQQAGVRVQISHHKAIGRNNWGKVKKSLALLEEARAEGIDISCDLYPYLAISTGLSSLLPDWVFGGSKDEVIIKIKKYQKEIITYLNQERAKKDGWDKIMIAEAKNYKEWEGLTIAKIAKRKGKVPAQVAVDLLIAEKLDVAMIRFSLAEDDLIQVLQAKFSMIGTDATSRVKDTILADNHCHPRTYGTFPRVINKYVKGGVLSLEEAIKKMTYLAAKKLGLNRGQLAPDLYADVVIFDLKKIKDKANYQYPHQYAQGIKYVIINGELVIKEGRQVSNNSGRVLKNKL